MEFSKLEKDYNEHSLRIKLIIILSLKNEF